MQNLLYKSVIPKICVGKTKIDKDSFVYIAGPCSIENELQAFELASKAIKCGATIIRGGAFKPRTSPYSFQGLGKLGLDILSNIKKEFGIPLVCEIVDTNDLELYTDIDILQVGARNMYNYSLLKCLSKQQKPILLKRAFDATVEEWLLSAEYILQGGNHNVILCERGIRFGYSNILDLNSVIAAKQLTNLPIIVDPTHASDDSTTVQSLAMAASTLDINGLMIEVSQDRQNAKSDGKRALTINELNTVIKKSKAIRQTIYK